MHHTPISVAIAAEHDFMRRGLSQFISSFTGFEIIHEINNENALLSHIQVTSKIPQICILDIKPNKIEAFEHITSKLKDSFPNIKVLAFLSEQNKLVILKMLDAGANCILSKYCSYSDLQFALEKLSLDGTYYPDYIAETLKNKAGEGIEFTFKERRFLTLCSSELTYKEIADKLNISLRATESIREGLFKKLNTVSRTGLVLKALKDGVISI